MTTLFRGIFLLAFACHTAVLSAATFTVTNTNDSGAGSLRQAIDDANNNVATTDTIEFNIPGPTPHVIQLETRLPYSYDPIIIDGTTQPGFTGFPLVEVDGQSSNSIGIRFIDGIGSVPGQIGADYSEVRGLSIYGFTSRNIGISASNCVIEGCFIGTDSTGTATNLGGANFGIGILNNPSNPYTHNLIKGNIIVGALENIFLNNASSTTIQGNLIGMNLNQVVVDVSPGVPTVYGIRITEGNNYQIGGTAIQERNFIVGADSSQILIALSNDGFIQGNWIGLSLSGGFALGGNGTSGGVRLDTCSNYTIGGSSLDGSGNGFGEHYNAVSLANSTGCVVKGNTMGVDSLTQNLGIPLRNGVQLFFSSDNIIGGEAPGEGNIIKNASQSGVAVIQSAFNTTIIGNSMANNNMAIDITRDARPFGRQLANDDMDPDSGPNDLQNYPELLALNFPSTGTSIITNFNSTPNSTFTIHYYSDNDCVELPIYNTDTQTFIENDDFGQGETYISGVTVTTDSNGLASFTITLPEIEPGNFISATATNSNGSTSELSPCLETILIDPKVKFEQDVAGFPGWPVNDGLLGPVRVEISNPAENDLQFTGAGITITGANASDFILADDTTTPTLAKGDRHFIDVYFDPSALGMRNAELTFTTNDPTSPTVSLPISGEGTSTLITSTYSNSGPGISLVGPGGDHPDLAAVPISSAVPLSGGSWVFLITDSYTEDSIIFWPINGESGHVHVVRPMPGVSPTIDIAGYNPSSSFWEIDANDNRSGNLIVDGSSVVGADQRDMTIRGPIAPDAASLIRISGHIENLIFKNVTLECRNTASSGSFVYGSVVMEGEAINGQINTGSAEYVTFDNCAFINENSPYAQGIFTFITDNFTPETAFEHILIKNSLFRTTGRGISTTGFTSLTVDSCTFYINQSSFGFDSQVVLHTPQTDPLFDDVVFNFTNNVIEENTAPTAFNTIGVSSLQLGAFGNNHTYNIINNEFRKVQLTGSSQANRLNVINFTPSTDATVNVYHNSINIVESPAAYSTLNSSNCFGIGFTNPGFTGTVNVFNNIIRNAQPNGGCLSFRNITGATINCDYNSLYATNGAIGRWETGTWNELPTWQSISGRDANSNDIDPAMGEATYGGRWLNAGPTGDIDLHFTGSPGPSFRAPRLANVLLDRDGNDRPTSTLMGSDEESTDDADDDGIPAYVEDLAPNNGDGNNDATPDSMQPDVASFANFGDGRIVTLATDNGVLSNVAAVENPSPFDAPENKVFPLGWISFAVTSLTPGDSAMVELFVPNDVTMEEYWKYGATPGNPADHWYEFTPDGMTGATLATGKVTLQLTDGLRGDDDLTTNGTILDPGGPAFFQLGIPYWELY